MPEITEADKKRVDIFLANFCGKMNGRTRRERIENFAANIRAGVEWEMSKKGTTTPPDPRALTAEAIVAAIDELRAEEAASVEIVCDNPDFNGLPNCVIYVSAEWTNWDYRRFTGETLLAALTAGVEAKKNQSTKVQP